ncbi:MAG: polymerase, sigma-24 subunit, subfamily [Flavipsychrobacter sp.]|nr:polymerase, sigma-24 subunit, subfamily [Flavipsychrobacter sp.]
MKPTAQLTHDFTELIKQHERIIHKVCNLYIINNPEDYKDLYQEIILQTWTAFPKFKHDAKVSTWLYRIALNTAISHKRSGSRKISAVPFDADLAQVADGKDSADDEYLLLWQLIRQLPQLEKALILLYLEDNSYEEIAAIMGLTVTNTGTRLGRIKEKLKKQAQTIQQ